MKNKNILFFILLYTCIPGLKSQVYFNNRYDISNSYDRSRGIVEINGGYMIAGGTETYPANIYLMFIDTLGDKKWVKTYQINGWPYTYCGVAGAIIKTKDDNIVVYGKANDNNDYKESLLMKLNQYGDTIWTKTYPINYPNINMVYNCIQTSDKGYLLAGVGANIPSNSDFLIIKTDSNGVFQWFKLIGDNKIEVAFSVMQTLDRSYLIGGIHYYLTGSNFHADPMIVKTDSMGNLKWSKLLGGSNDDYPAMVCMSKDSNYIVAYTYTEYFSQGYCFGRSNITKLDTAGNIIWNKKYGPIYQNNNLTKIKSMPDGGFLVCGFTDHPQFTFYQVGWLLRINANGDSLWYREYANYVHNEVFNNFYDFVLTKDKGIVCVGEIDPNNTGGTYDIWVLKTDSVGCLVPNCTGIGITEFNPNAGAQLLVYPNPFKEAFAINYSIPKEGKKGVFMLYNVYGRLVYTTPLSTNVNQLQVVATTLKAGVYVATYIVDGTMVCSQKIIKE